MQRTGEREKADRGAFGHGGQRESVEQVYGTRGARDQRADGIAGT